MKYSTSQIRVVKEGVLMIGIDSTNLSYVVMRCRTKETGCADPLWYPIKGYRKFGAQWFGSIGRRMDIRRANSILGAHYREKFDYWEFIKSLDDIDGAIERISTRKRIEVKRSWGYKRKQLEKLYYFT